MKHIATDGAAYSGSRVGFVIGTVIIIAIGYLAAHHMRDVILPLFQTKPSITAIALLVLCPIVLIAGIQMHIYGIFSVRCTKEALLHRRYIFTKKIPWSSIANLGFSREKTRRSVANTFIHIYYVHANGEQRIHTISLFWFSRKQQKKIFASLTRDHQAVPCSKELRHYIRGLTGKVVPNPLSPTKKWLIPAPWYRRIAGECRLSEATLFLMAVSLIVMIWLDKESIGYDMARIVALVLQTPRGVGVVFILFFCGFFGFLLSIYHLIARGKKGGFSQCCMLTFGMVVSIGSGILGAVRVLEQDTRWLPMILATWNIIFGILVLFSIDSSKKTYIEHHDAKLSEILIGLVIIAWIIYSGRSQQWYWADVLSACIAYSTAVNGSIRKWLPAFHRSMPTVGIQMPRIPGMAERKVHVKTKIILTVFLIIFISSLILFQRVG